MMVAATTHCPHCDASGAPGARGVPGEKRGICAMCARALTVCGGVRLGAEIDRGGVARIHAATLPDGGDAAVKILERTPIHSSAVHRLFARSARLLSGLGHPGLPRVIGFETNRRRSFFAMERLRGGTLWSRVSPTHHGKLMTGAQLDRLLRRLLETAAYLHARDLVHGDITPRNVMFRAAGEDDAQPVLVDFDGLCTAKEKDVASLVMTPGYTAPEQRVGELSFGSDLYGIGATVIFAATGKAPDRLERLGTHLDVELASAPDLSPTTRRVLGSLVALDPLRRPASARAALSALDAAEPRADRRNAPLRPVAAAAAARWLGARLLVAALLALLVFGLAVGLLAFTGVAPARPM
jgi:serine/threonine protein kinase